jgi:hypothetical protein
MYGHQRAIAVASYRWLPERSATFEQTTSKHDPVLRRFEFCMGPPQTGRSLPPHGRIA